jgi:hypothetical protein
MDLSNIALTAMKIGQNPQVRSCINKLIHKIYKRLTLKPCEIVIIEDNTRINLEFKYNEQKYQLIDLEKIFKTLTSSTEEKENMKNIKLSSYELYVYKYKAQIKIILNLLRNEHRDKIPLILLSDISLCNALHLNKNVKIFLMSDELFNETLKPLDNETQNYLKCNRNKHIDKKEFTYNNIEELKYMLSYLYS